MTPVIKFQHLLKALEGEAESKLKGLEVTGENFATAWESLRSRYDNIFLRFSTHFNALLTLPSSAQETSAHLSSLLNKSINAFKLLKLPVEHWDMVFIQCIESKLAPASRMDWVKQIETIQDGSFPKFDCFKRFLEDRIQTLDRVEAVSQSAADSKAKSSAVNIRIRLETNQRERAQRSMQRFQSRHSHLLQGHRRMFPAFTVRGLIRSTNVRVLLLFHRSNGNVVTSKGLCTNCLSNRHKTDHCNSPVRCYMLFGILNIAPLSFI